MIKEQKRIWGHGGLIDFVNLGQRDLKFQKFGAEGEGIQPLGFFNGKALIMVHQL